MPLTYSKKTSTVVFLLFAISLAGVFMGLYLYLKNSLTQTVYNSDIQSLTASESALVSDISSLTRDIRFLSKNFTYHYQNTPNRSELNQTIAIKWRQIMAVSEIYDQIRWIDQMGQERIRVQKKEGVPHIIEQSQLQNKSNRYYFSNTILLPEGQIFISPLDLNIEHNQIEIPHKPTLRIAMPLFNNHQKIGILVMNIRANFFLQKIKDSHLAQTWLVNSEGYWLKSSTPQDEWGFMLGHTETTMPYRYPQSWQKINSGKKGQFSDHAGIWSYDTVFPIPQDAVTSVNSAQETDQIAGMNAYYWKLVTFTPKTFIAEKINNQIPILALIYFILLVFGLMLISRLYQARMTEEENIRAIKASNTKLKQTTDELQTEVNERIQSEKKLLQLTDQYYNIIESTSDAFLLLDKSGKLLDLNSAFAKLYGQHPSSLKGLAIQTLTKIEQIDTLFNTLQPKLWETGTFKTELTLHSLDTPITLDAVFSAIYSNHHICVFLRDISEMKQNLQRFELAASVFSHAHEGIMIADKNNVIMDVNAEFERITGYRKDEAIGQTPHFLRSGRHDYLFYEAMNKDLETKGHWYGEVWNRRKTGELYAEFLSISTVKDTETDEVHHYVALFTDITWEKQYQKQLERIAHYDPLTSLPNRLLLADRIKQATSQADRNNTLLAVAFIDLDEFKAINDSLGHEVGDMLLNTTSKRMLSCVREVDTVARLGGDEFVILLGNLKTKDDIFPMIEQILREVSQPVIHNDKKLEVSASIGITYYPQLEHTDGDQLIRQADQSMYSAKLEGKNRYHIYDPAHDKNIRGLHQSIEEVRSALEKNELMLYYQPKVDMRNGRIIGFEALIRWNHPERGILGPNLFLPMIEQSDLSIDISRWVIQHAMQQITDLRAAHHDYPISVNLGTYELQQTNFLEWLSQSLMRFPPECESLLELEILETHVLGDIDHITNIIKGCQSKGIRVSLDDFGTGYSSLSYLKKLPVDILKIDQSFVRSLFTAPEEYNMLEGIIGLVKNLDCEIIAEGVETEEHGLALLQLGCRFAQGYHIARPMPADELMDWIENWSCPESWLKAPYEPNKS